MNIFGAFEVSAAGMNVERMRLDVSATNLANANTSRGADGVMFKPLRLVTHSVPAFPELMDGMLVPASIPQSVEVETLDTPAREVYEPGHPDADERGFVAYPGVDPVSEMVQLVAITRAYEANVRAFNAAKSMALKALELGSER
jgi:flagellar basal-body rod protein FlgC